MSKEKPTVKQNKTICIDHDINEIVEEINNQGGKLSPVVCNLLRFYRDNDYRIPANSGPVFSVTADSGVDDEDKQQQGETVAEWHARIGIS